jgi:PIN domain nuclease of toxin-antitoxin system
MNEYVTDTQALVKFMQNKLVVNKEYHQIYENAEVGKDIIIIPAIVLMEIMYLCEKNRIPVSVFDIEQLLDSKNYRLEPLTLEILKVATSIDDIPELHDRLIAATAVYLDLPIITNDEVILNSKHIKTIPTRSV